jgi:hypothetical protein
MTHVCDNPVGFSVQTGPLTRSVAEQRTEKRQMRTSGTSDYCRNRVRDAEIRQASGTHGNVTVLINNQYLMIL